jgi:hypothetical protein
MYIFIHILYKAKVKKITNTSVNEDMGKLELSYISGEKVRCYNHSEEHLVVSHKVTAPQW